MTQSYQAKSAKFLVTPERQVKWFAVRQLLITAWQSLAATVIGPMTGRRELMSALDREARPAADYSAREEIWLDYVADAGDGWNATLSVAWLLGRNSLVLREDGAPTPQPIPAGQEEVAPHLQGAVHLPHGQALIFGGDQVYPTASAKAYQQRLVDPYSCARYFQNPPRDVLALPGNHDWYDGLTSFLRLFCQAQENRRWLGAWGTLQRRSYFAIKLPHGWWLWGVDMALEDDLDPPQYEYFRARSRELAQDDQVILCLPTPVWLKQDASAAISDQVQYRMASKLKIIADLADGNGQARAPVYLTGDNHHYAHYFSAAADASHYIVCGGGGAFGLGTLSLHSSVRVATSKERFVSAECKTLFPDRETSKQMRRGALKFPLHNVSFTVLLACIQFITLWLVNTAAANASGSWFAQMLRADGFMQLWPELTLLLRAPAATLWLLLVLLGFSVYAVSGRAVSGPKWPAVAAGLAHGLAQTVGSVGCVWLVIKLTASVLPELGVWHFTVATAVSFALLFFYCGTLFGVYLVCSHKFLHLHDQDVFFRAEH
ncbi:MAG: hypothetical protein NVV73_18980 [Cellvibrionaceae bacterium]|nr:hypothetical protein [Cellvibrionaceae bacterium]